MANSSRREFIKLSSLASGMLFVPNFLHALDSTTVGKLPNANGRRLVVIQLDGGNDGLNTVIPYQNDLYYKARPSLAIKVNDVLKLDKELGFNPAMAKMRSLYEQGYVTILNGVGYPNPDRSHFRSTDIWHSASASDEYLNTGWVGRYLDSLGHTAAGHTAIEVDDNLSLALKGDRVSGLAVQNVQKFFEASNNTFLKKAAQQHHAEHAHHQVNYLYKTLRNTQQSADYIYHKTKVYRTGQEYPGGEFGRNLKTMAELITSGVDSRVYYASLSGFDTHARQAGQQANLLKELSEGVYSFVQDLKKQGEFDNTVIMVFSEFGRRVAQNASNGTDHGTANNLFLISGSLNKPGIYNDLPSLSNLDQGDLKYNLDFRSVYASVLQDWLKADTSKIINKAVKPLPYLFS